MKISLNWLTDYVDVSMPARQLADLLTGIGLNCDSISETESDIVLELDVTSNRPDWLGHLGVARELAAATGAAFKPPQVKPLPSGGQVATLTSVQVLAPDLCPRYTARAILGVKIGPSPSWMVERLAAVGMRSVNNVVDVTNYVLMEYSQPLHAFDYDKLSEHRIVVRRAADGEHIIAIDGTKCELHPDMLVIADAQRPVAVAGVMGGLNTEVGPNTVNILLESAQFDPLSVRRTSRKLGLMSESNYRFERGVDPVALDEASLRACQLIVELAGGRLVEGVVDVWDRPFEPPQVALRPQRTNAILGLEVTVDRQMAILAGLGLRPKLSQGRIACDIPSHRADLTREADLVEEVARIHGYDKIPLADKVTHAVVAEQAPQRLRREIGAALTAAGFDEAITPSFIDLREAELFGQPSPICVDQRVRRTNNALRPTVIPSLLRCCKTNQDAGNEDVSLFELAAVFPPPVTGLLPKEFVQLGLVTMRDMPQLRGALAIVVERIAGRLKLDVLEGPVPGMSEGACGELALDGEVIGAIGAVAPHVLEHYGLERPVYAAAMRFDALLHRATGVKLYQPLPRFPSAKRDLSFLVDEDVTWRQIERVIDGVPQPTRVGLDYVTTYRGKPVPDGCKSVTLTLTYRSEEGTLRSEQVDQWVEEVMSAMARELSAELRK